MKILIFTIIAITTRAHCDNNMPPCIFDNKSQVCDLFKNSTETFLSKNKDGRVLPNFPKLYAIKTLEDGSIVSKNLVTERDLNNLANPDPIHIKEGKAIEKELVATAVQLIQKNRSDADLSAGEKSAILRLKTVKFELYRKDDPQCHLLNKLNAPVINATYIEARHSIAVCPVVFNLSKTAFIGTLSHELGHVTDPSHLSLPLQSDHTGKLFVPYVKMTAVMPIQDLAPAVPPNEHPYIKTTGCIQNKYAADLGLSVNDISSENWKPEFDEIYADVMGSKIMGTYLKDSTVTDPYEQLAMVGDYEGEDCQGFELDEKYLTFQDRIDIFANNPEIRKSFGCAPTTNSRCYIDDAPLPSRAKQKSNNKKARSTK
ncbi:MAG: hypothetical protein ABL927_03640 [Bdellovibrionales bacterium]